MIEIHGDEQVIADFTKAGLLVGIQAGHVVWDAGEEVAEKAKGRVPTGPYTRSPQLGHSITSEMVGPLEAEIGPENDLGGGYGHIVEKGLAGNPPQPYLSPALDEVEREILKDFDRMIGTLL